MKRTTLFLLPWLLGFSVLNICGYLHGQQRTDPGFFIHAEQTFYKDSRAKFQAFRAIRPHESVTDYTLQNGRSRDIDSRRIRLIISYSLDETETAPQIEKASERFPHLEVEMREDYAGFLENPPADVLLRFQIKQRLAEVTSEPDLQKNNQQSAPAFSLSNSNARPSERLGSQGGKNEEEQLKGAEKLNEEILSSARENSGKPPESQAEPKHQQGEGLRQYLSTKASAQENVEAAAIDQSIASTEPTIEDESLETPAHKEQPSLALDDNPFMDEKEDARNPENVVTASAPNSLLTTDSSPAIEGTRETGDAFSYGLCIALGCISMAGGLGGVFWLSWKKEIDGCLTNMVLFSLVPLLLSFPFFSMAKAYEPKEQTTYRPSSEDDWRHSDTHSMPTNTGTASVRTAWTPASDGNTWNTASESEKRNMARRLSIVSPNGNSEDYFYDALETFYDDPEGITTDVSMDDATRLMEAGSYALPPEQRKY